MNIINHKIISILSIIIVLTLSACSHDHNEGDGHNHGSEEAHSEDDGHGHGHGDEAAHGDGEIHLTRVQIKTMNIQFGDFSDMKINDYISTTGHWACRQMPMLR